MSNEYAKYAKRDMKGRILQKDKEKLIVIMRITKQERDWILEKRRKEND